MRIWAKRKNKKRIEKGETTLSRRLQAIARIVGIGWYIGLSIILPAWGGWWLDHKLNTYRFFFFLGLMFGIMIASLGTYRFLHPIARKDDNGKAD